MMIYTEYETIYVVKPELPDDALSALNEKVAGIIEKNDGTMLIVDDWGKRKLAYPIQKNSKGHYVYINFAGPSSLIAELERNLRIEDNLLRFLTVKLGVDIDLEAKKAAAVEESARRAEAAAARAEAEAEAAARAAEAEAIRAEKAAKAAERAEKAEAAEATAAPAEGGEA